MTAVKVVTFVVFVLSVQVVCWTVDLSEMNKLDAEMVTTEKNEEINEEERMKNDINDEYQTTNNYAEDLEYQSYMEKRIHGVLNNGSIYLDGLRKAMAHYRETLENCSTLSTTPAPSTWLPENGTYQQSEEDICRSVLAASDQVTKLSELALWATNELRERKFAKDKESAQEEEELLLKLAWFLDQLAQLTGYAPDPSDFQTTTLEFTTTEPTITTDTQTPTTDTSDFEIMQSVENGPPLSKFAPKNLKITKRSVDETTNFIKNYVKYKVWNSDNDNGNRDDKNDDSFDVQNHLNVKPIQKRSVSTKKATIMRPLSLRNLSKMNYKSDPKKRVNRLLKKYRVKDKKTMRKIDKKMVQKRSVIYYSDVISRIPENPMQDLSYYAKSKPGTIINPSFSQEDNVYHTLREHLNVHHLDEVKRFGANVTVGVVALNLGINKTLADS
ncbi:uncharacterized protein LOC119838927 [Zerene cesonia]|uniref:uncharacterized protein LOC119838927 n=1 Tax=Zerene cesonia TaxID=33412 RepID=UPI0018E56EAC|nr:uncharacterized protein LOC119838927 [Zerene cesonia]